MQTLITFIKRNVKLFFCDKGMFFTSLITPVILLVLYGFFLSDIYRDSLIASSPEGVLVPSRIIDGLVGGQLISSILAVSCVTVAFCSNFLMVQDKALGARRDLTVSPVKRSTLAVGYYLASLISTLIICFSALGLCLIYVAVLGWYLSALDVILLILDVFLLGLFGTAISSVIGFFLSTQGQISAVGTVVSSGYGFICGAYMPISTFGEGLRHVISFLPGTYGTALIRNHSVRGALAALEGEGVASELVDGIREAIDCRIYFFDIKVENWAMYTVLISSILLFIGGYVLLNRFSKQR